MTVDMNGFKEMVQELIEDGNLDVLEMMRETVSKARRTVKSNKKKEEKKKANGQKIQERIKRMSEGVVITSAKETEVRSIITEASNWGRVISDFFKSTSLRLSATILSSMFIFNLKARSR